METSSRYSCDVTHAHPALLSWKSVQLGGSLKGTIDVGDVGIAALVASSHGFPRGKLEILVFRKQVGKTGNHSLQLVPFEHGLDNGILVVLPEVGFLIGLEYYCHYYIYGHPVRTWAALN